jgi:hypothetical protein
MNQLNDDPAIFGFPSAELAIEYGRQQGIERVLQLSRYFHYTLAAAVRI